MIQHMGLYIFDSYKPGYWGILSLLNIRVYSLEDFQYMLVNMSMMVFLEYRDIHCMDHTVRVCTGSVELPLEVREVLKVLGYVYSWEIR